MSIINIGLRLISVCIFIVSTLFLTLLAPWLLVFTIPAVFIGMQGINENREESCTSLKSDLE